MFFTADTTGGQIKIMSIWTEELTEACLILCLKPHEQYNKFRQLRYLLWKGFSMATKKGTNHDAAKRPTGATEFVNVYLSEDDDPSIQVVMDTDDGTLLGEYLAIIETGVDFQLKQGQHDDFCAMFFWTMGKGDHARNFGVSAFASNPRDALVGLLYKFVVRLDRGNNATAKADTPKRRFR